MPSFCSAAARCFFAGLEEVGWVHPTQCLSFRVSRTQTDWIEMEAYLRKVGSQYHARAIAMVRLDLMSVDWEIDRWNRVPYAERRCRECGATRGDVCHLISGCPALPALRGGEPGAACWNFLVNAQHEDGAMWRRVARHIEQSWRGLEQARNTRKTTAGHAPGLLLGVLSH